MIGPSVQANRQGKRANTGFMKVLIIPLVVASILFGSIGYLSRPLILTNGRIMTMDSDNRIVSAMGVHASRISAVGEHTAVEASMQRLQANAPWYTRLFDFRRIDLQGRTVMPGFIDAHSHFPASGIATAGIDVSSPPFGKTTTIAELVETVSESAQARSDNGWIIGFNYDDAGLSEKRHPTRAELDLAAPDHAVYLRHRSGHMGVANSQALRELGFDVASAGSTIDDVDPSGQAVEARRDRNRVSGLLQEHAAPGLKRLLKELSWWELPGIVFRARDEYLRAGVTTVQNGFADKQTFQILRWSSKLGIVPQRLLFWPAHDKQDTLVLQPLPAGGAEAEIDSGQRLARSIGWPEDKQQTLKISALKLVADGSPQGRTAKLVRPYLKHENPEDDFDGVAYIGLDELHALISDYHRAGIQLAIHGNGDAAVQSIIDGIRIAQNAFPRSDARHLLVHAQVTSESQLAELSELGVGVSFFPAHTFYWGDWYRHTVLGELRARFISPLASADAAGVQFSIHSDSPVTPMNPMQMLWSATERLTSSGYLLGADQRVSRLRGLRAMTIDAAWQNFLDDDRGSLEPGKLADFVILSDDPLTADDVRQISIRQVWIGGKRHLP